MELLRARKIEQKAFAKEIGVTESIVSEWKAGKTKSYLKRLPRIAEYLEIPIDTLLDESVPVPVISVGDISNNGHNVIGVGDNSPVSIVPDVKTASNKQEEDLLRIFKMLDGKGQHKLMSIAYALEEEISKS